jgi:hypothetical protein
MTMLPARRSRRNFTIVSPSREFEDDEGRPRRIEITG